MNRSSIQSRTEYVNSDLPRTSPSTAAAKTIKPVKIKIVNRPISITFTILSLLLVLGLLKLWPPASPAGGPLPALQGEIVMKKQEPITMRTQNRSLMLGSVAALKHFLGIEAR